MILKLAAGFSCWNFCYSLSVSCSESSEIKNEEIAMTVALEVNFALWIMIGCATVKAFQFAGCLI
jgi:hypothetical protein